MKLYKYRSEISRDFETLFSNRLFAPDKDNLNDPAEMCFDDSDFLRFLNKNKKYSKPVKVAFDDLKNFVTTKCGIFSLSKEVNNELLWAYYAIGHKGFCIEYDTDIIMESYNYGLELKNNLIDPFPLVHQIEVDYQSYYPVFKTEFLEMQDWTQALKCIAGTKSKSWEKEKEVRLIFDKHGYTEIDYRAITGIYFGVRFCDDKAKKNVMQKLQGRNIKYYQMKFADMSYNMSFYEIKDIYASAPKYVANSLSYNNIEWTGSPSDSTKYKDLAIQALDYVSREPCINKIRSCFVSSHPLPIITIEAYVNDDFKIFPIKYYRFDIGKNKIKLRRFQFQ